MIIDTHTHFYDPTRPQGVPWPPQNNPLLYRRVLPEHYRVLAAPEGVTGTIVVEASPWIEDNQWVLDLAQNEPLIIGLVGNLDPTSDDFVKHLNRFEKNPLFRGIRLGRNHLQTITQSTLIPNLSQLSEKDLSLDLLVGPDLLVSVSELAAQLPALRIILNHVAHVPITGKTPDPEWIDGLHRVADHPSIYCKISGLVEMAQQTPAPEDSAYYAPTLDHLWQILGPDRLLYGSNWPVCERAAKYTVVQHIVKEYVKSIGPEAAEKIFWKNAKTAYKWIDRK
ncbi:MAG: amidohydrolase family protein [bacterium]|nr:amidohydrolase family protein [bacterium]